MHDVVIAGGGPAGASCAAFCARAGLRTLLIERVIFPRDKVCGDCLNPRCWPIFDRLGIADRILASPHAKLREVRFVGLDENSIGIPFESGGRGEIAVRRRDLDDILLRRAIECGAEVRQGIAISAVSDGWKISIGGELVQAKILVAADGRNSTVARLLRLLPAAAKDRIGAQAHIIAPPKFGERIELRFFADGYCGLAPIGGGLLNVCAVARPARMPALQKSLARHFSLGDVEWRTVTPLARGDACSSRENLFLIGDAARVVEPFTGEGIFYALASGELAAAHIVRGSTIRDFEKERAKLYRGRLWVNRLARSAVLHPQIASHALTMLRRSPWLLEYLTRRVSGG